MDLARATDRKMQNGVSSHPMVTTVAFPMRSCRILMQGVGDQIFYLSAVGFRELGTDCLPRAALKVTIF